MTLHLTTLVHSYLRARWYFTRLRGEALERYQDRRARRVVAHARRHSPYYRTHFAGHATAAWRQLPTTDKAGMMAAFDTFPTLPLRYDEVLAVALRAESDRDFRPTVRGVTVGLSSGTSGHRGLFLVSPAEQAAWAGTMLARTLPGWRRRGYRVAFFLRSNSNLYESLRGRWLHFQYYDLMTPLPDAVAALNREPPDYLVGPPSLLGLLAAARQSGALRIRPERLYSVAEVLEPQDRDHLADVFGCPVHQIYQCTEGLLAVGCPRGALHVQEDLVALQLEPLDGEGEGARYTPVVTDLWRTTQPILRYRLNDVVTLDPRPCPCGSAFRVLARVEGRCDDLCYFLGPGGEPRPFFADTVRRMILLASPDIRDYQAFQERPGHLRIHLDLAPGAALAPVAAAVVALAEATVQGYACRPPRLQVVEGLVPLPPDRKRRRVRRWEGDA